MHVTHLAVSLHALSDLLLPFILRFCGRRQSCSAVGGVCLVCLCMCVCVYVYEKLRFVVVN